MKMEIQILHEKALNASQRYLQAESDLIQILGTLDACRGYRDLKCRSLFEYANTTLGLSEAVACNLIVVARKARSIVENLTLLCAAHHRWVHR